MEKNTNDSENSLPIGKGMGTLDSIDWSKLPPSKMQDPPPGTFDMDPWHPAPADTRHQKWGFADFAGGPTLSFVDWLHNANMPAADQDPDTWTGVVHAYQSLPEPWAVESVIFAHILYICRVIQNWVWRSFNCNVTQNDDDFFSVALLKIVEIVPSLLELGQQRDWDNWDAPEYIAAYLGTSVRNQLFRDLIKLSKEHDAILTFLQSQRCPIPIPATRSSFSDHSIYLVPEPYVKKKKKEKDNKNEPKKEESTEELERRLAREMQSTSIVDGLSFYMAYDDMTPDKILQLKEEAQQKKSFGAIFGSICEDIFDMFLLTMKREGILTETEMGELYGGKPNGLGRDAVNRRLARLHVSLQEELGFEPDICSKYREQSGKRCTRNPKKRKLANEVLASWREPERDKPENSAKRAVVPVPHFITHQTPDCLSISSLADSSTIG